MCEGGRARDSLIPAPSRFYSKLISVSWKISQQKMLAVSFFTDPYLYRCEKPRDVEAHNRAMEAYQEPTSSKREPWRPVLEIRVSLMRVSIRSFIEVKSRIRASWKQKVNPIPHGSEMEYPELHESEKWVRIRMEVKSESGSACKVKHWKATTGSRYMMYRACLKPNLSDERERWTLRVINHL